MAVVFPAPFAPRKPKISPLFTSNEILLTALKLPKALSWYNYENGVPTTKRNDVQFVNVKLSKTKPIDEMFKVPDTTMIIK